MNITILKPLGEIGIITDWKTLIPDNTICVNISGESEGSLTIGQRTYAVKNGKVSIPEYEIVLGESRVVLSCASGNYFCGTINRNGRFIKVSCPVDKLIVACALRISAQAVEIEELREEIKTIKKQYGISLI